MKKYRYKMQNLDCANCAREIEEYLSKDEKLANIIVNYSKLSLSLESDLDNVKNYVAKKVKEVEPDVKLLSLDEENDNKKTILKEIIFLVLALLFSILGFIIKDNLISKILIIVSYIILLYDIAIKALKLICTSKVINENLLITISCIGAYFTGNIFEGLAVIILYKIGEILEHLAVNSSRKSIASLMDIKPDYANLKKEKTITQVNPNEVKIDDIIIVKNGEKIPLDGEVIKGTSLLDTSAITGESKLKSVSVNDQVLSGCINKDDLLEIKVSSLYEDSTVSRILELVENATDRKAKTENFVSKAAKVYTPIVILLAILVTILFPLILDIPFKDSLYRALSFLVISCPCAIAISVPLSYFSGIGACSKEGILIKGSDYLDSLKDVNKIIFDKTGTITKGQFTKFNLVILNKNYHQEEIIDYYLKGESFSTHPLATAIIKYFNKDLITDNVKNFKEIAGKGISYDLKNQKILIGSARFVKSNIIDNAIYLKIDNIVVAKLELEDTIKDDVKETINYLNDANIKTMMFTGDEKNTAIKIGKEANINNIKYELLPQDKFNLLEKEILQNAKNKKVAFVGDGINDAPSLARADIGIGMGSIGSASATQAADIIIANDEIRKIIKAIKISKKTDKIIKENLCFALGIKVLVLILTVFGISSMWQAVFADTGVTLLTIINTTRILKTK